MSPNPTEPSLDSEDILDREMPLRNEAPEAPIVLRDDADEQGADREDALVADAEPADPLLGISAEEAAVHVVADAPGAVEGPDSYLPDAETG